MLIIPQPNHFVLHIFHSSPHIHVFGHLFLVFVRRTTIVSVNKMVILTCALINHFVVFFFKFVCMLAIFLSTVIHHTRTPFVVVVKLNCHRAPQCIRKTVFTQYESHALRWRVKVLALSWLSLFGQFYYLNNSFSLIIILWIAKVIGIRRHQRLKTTETKRKQEKKNKIKIFVCN